MTEEIIAFKHIEKSFPGIVALNDISFSINKGEIHAIVGANGAGKSTLMHILSGIYTQDHGQIIYKGKPVTISNPQAARQLGIATVYQELKLCPNLNVAENVFLGREENTILGRINKKKMHLKAEELLNQLNIDIDTHTLIRKLTIAKRQIVEIVKAMSLNADVLILDEPTSSLTMNETERLFLNLRQLQKRSVTMIYIGHRLDEVFKISNRISILRDGRYIGTFNINDISSSEVVAYIADKELQEELIVNEYEEKAKKQEIALEVRNFSRGKYFEQINFKLYLGELLGLYGLQGSGRTELIETIFGLFKPDSGKILLFGKEQKIKNPRDAIKKGLSLITEDRRKTGLFSNMDVKDNVVIVHKKIISFLNTFMRKRKMLKIAENFVKKLDIKLASITQNVINLSGGNQQKVIISRWLSRNPPIILMDEPTKGIDVSAKAEIYKILKNLRENEGKSIIVVSSELPEVVAECDRVIILRNGRIAGEVEGADMQKEKILHYAFSG